MTVDRVNVLIALSIDYKGMPDEKHYPATFFYFDSNPNVVSADLEGRLD